MAASFTIGNRHGSIIKVQECETKATTDTNLVWADTLLAAERAHLLRLASWGALSALLGSTLYTVLTVRATVAPILRHFAIQMAMWGVFDVILALTWSRMLHERDLGGAVHLSNMLWLHLGLDVGLIAVGVTLALAGWRLGQRLSAVGAGMGVVAQGLGLLVLNATLLRHIVLQ